jgi:hypothetical protein
MLVKVKQNAWGNYKCSIGRSVVCDYGTKWDATCWLMGILDSGEYTLSKKSDITLKNINELRERLES